MCFSDEWRGEPRIGELQLFTGLSPSRTSSSAPPTRAFGPGEPQRSALNTSPHSGPEAESPPSSSARLYGPAMR